MLMFNCIRLMARCDLISLVEAGRYVPVVIPSCNGQCRKKLAGELRDRGRAPAPDRIQRWDRAIGEGGRQPRDREELLRLQRIVLGDACFTASGRDADSYLRLSGARSRPLARLRHSFGAA